MGRGPPRVCLKQPVSLRVTPDSAVTLESDTCKRVTQESTPKSTFESTLENTPESTLKSTLESTQILPRDHSENMSLGRARRNFCHQYCYHQHWPSHPARYWLAVVLSSQKNFKPRIWVSVPPPIVSIKT